MNYKRKRDALKAQKPLSEPIDEKKLSDEVVEKEDAHEEIEHVEPSHDNNRPKRRSSERVSR